MPLEVLRFELKHHFRHPLLYVFAASFFVMALLIMSSDVVMPIGRGSNIARNSPFAVFNTLSFLSVFGMVAAAFIVAPAVNRDHEWRTQELFFSTPLRKTGYLLGRFAGATFPLVAAMMMSCVAMGLAPMMPWQDPERFLAFNMSPYLYSVALFILPNLYVMGAVFFSVATLTKKTFMAYVAVLVLIVLYSTARGFLGDLENQALVSMLDPFGWSAFRIMTQYWTVAERNTELLPLSGLLLSNRILWTCAGTGLLTLTVIKFRMFADDGNGRRRPRQRLLDTGETTTMIDAVPACSIHVPAAADFTFRGRLAQLISYTTFETRSILRGTAFHVVILFGALNLIARLLVVRGGATPWPLTQEMLHRIHSGFWIYPMVVIVIYGADLIWKDRRAGINEITDSLPIPNWIPLLSRFSALYVICALMLVFAMLCTVGYQAFRGYFDFELVLYFKALCLVALSEWMLFAALAIFCQVLGGNLFVGTLLYVFYLLVQEVPADLGYEHHLYVFPTAPEAPYSDMNGYGHFAAPLFWYRLYWGFFAAGMMILANWLWVRGTDNRFSQRIYNSRSRMTRRSVGALAIAALGFVVVGTWIFYNTNVLNRYWTERSIDEMRADYERQYKQYNGVAQPKVTAARLEVDIHPESRMVDIRGNLQLVNKTNVAVSELHVFTDPNLTINSFSLPQHSVGASDLETGYRIFVLARPLLPGDSLDFGFDVTSINRGFVNDHSNVQVVNNGTFITNSDYVPQIGYSPSFEVQEPDRRKQYGLPDLPRIAAVDDTVALRRIFTPDADRIDFEATVSTSPDQIAIAPGYLQREWESDRRRYFHYKMDVPILNFYCFVSGRYEVTRDTWENIPIEVYHHPSHDMNTRRMIESVRRSLDYFTKNFGPYPYRQLRIIEFPGYRSFAQSFPNTIPFSEAIHFVDDLRDPDKLDRVFYVTAHEVAHQWWAHQVTAANVQGGNMIDESLSQYSALMVMEQDYGAHQMRKFLRHELDRYLRGRTQELDEEVPLMLVGDQPYIFYAKGSLAMYALREYIGENVFNAALRRYLKETAFQGPPYTNSIELLAHMRRVVPKRYEYLIEDMFETITLYDNRMENVVATKMENGAYRLVLTYQSHKYRADGKGTESEVDHADWFEIGVYGEGEGGGTALGKTLYRQKHRLASGSGDIEIVVDEKPVLAGIDPRNILIDRFPEDNVKRVSH